jgi:hypothetical protein
MSQTEFNALCTHLLIAPNIALENDELRNALASRNDAEVKRILTEEF